MCTAAPQFFYNSEAYWPSFMGHGFGAQKSVLELKMIQIYMIENLKMIQYRQFYYKIRWLEFILSQMKWTAPHPRKDGMVLYFEILELHCLIRLRTALVANVVQLRLLCW